MRRAAGLWSRFVSLFDEPQASEPVFDPVHLGAAAVGSLVVVGLLYWLFWTLLVYEGGLFTFGRGKVGNICALVVLGGLIAGLHRLYFTAVRRHGSGPAR